MTTSRLLAALAAALTLSACQSSQTASSAGAPVAAQATPAAGGAALAATAPQTGSASTQTAFAATHAGQPVAAGQCATPIVGGPPPKPAKGTDFAKNAIGNNLKRNVARNSISMLGSAIAGPLGGAVAQGVATSQIRTEQDLKGMWAITDGRSDCGCQIDVSSGVNLQMKSANAGVLQSSGCANPLLAQAARWTLGHSFTGYDVPLTLLARDRATVLATLNRDGLNYFSGSLADGTPVTLWRRGG